MKKSWIMVSLLIVIGVAAAAYSFVFEHNPCVGDRSYDCLVAQHQIIAADISWTQQIQPIPVTPQTQKINIPAAKKITPSYVPKSVVLDTTLADQEAAAKLAKQKADAQILATQQAATKLAADQAAAAQLAQQQADALAAQQAAALAAQQAAAQPVVHEQEHDD